MSEKTFHETALENLKQRNPTAASSFDSLANLVHAVFVAHGFRLTALGDPSTPVDGTNDSLPSGLSTLTLSYRHTESAMTFRVTIVQMGTRTMIHATGDDEHVHSLELRTLDHVRDAEFRDWDRAFPQLSTTVGQIRSTLCQRLVHQLNKPGYEDTTPSQQSQQQQQIQPSTQTQPPSSQPPRYDQQPSRQPLVPDPRIDPLRDYSYQPRRPMVGNPFDDDLNGGLPVMPRMPFQSGPFGGFGGSGGMHLGPGNPMFGIPPIHPSGEYRLPRGAVPPGARFDPYGPPGMGGFPQPQGPPRRNFGDVERPGPDDDNPYFM